MTKTLDEILYAHNDAIKSLHHKIKYQNLNPTPDELLGMEDAVSAKAKQAITSLIKELVEEAALIELYRIEVAGSVHGLEYRLAIKNRIAELSKEIK